MRLKKAISRIDQNWFFLLIVSAAVSAVFLLFASPYTTPLNRYYGYDSAFFLLIGKGIRHGMLPYLDLYDQKGPMIFYINALGYLLTDSRLGVFLLQVVFVCLCLPEPPPQSNMSLRPSPVSPRGGDGGDTGGGGASAQNLPVTVL